MVLYFWWIAFLAKSSQGTHRLANGKMSILHLRQNVVLKILHALYDIFFKGWENEGRNKHTSRDSGSSFTEGVCIWSFPTASVSTGSHRHKIP